MVRHNETAQQFEAVVEGELCRAHYRRTGNVLAMNHTEVPPRVARRGIAAELVRAAVEVARVNGLRIAPHCSYVRDYFTRHPEARDVLA
jgi:predicted GNAT family acetyltransferase